ncbi:MAG TPA: SGNH/GDSL hydrolase family protein [Jatrophihabitantaceae bacterium]|nr:SGNH/GDSL hydrolase family protein [Jatrophihabitantaceae bacterium]
MTSSSAPLPLPVRVLVKGASTVGWTSFMGGPRTDLGFPRVIEQSLLQSGRPAEVRTYSVPSERTKSTLRTWEYEMIGYSPDVVVLVYGHYETIHLFLPHWLETLCSNKRARSGPVRTLVRKHIIRPVWLLLAQLQSKLDRIVKPTIRGDRPRRVAADLEKLIKHTQELHSPLVYLFELLPPAHRYSDWFPGMAARIGVMNETLEDLVTRIDKPNVRYLRVSEIVDTLADGDLDVATPDGFHYSPAMHRAIGERLADDIAAWADTQAHLRISGPRAVTDEQAG